MESLMKKASKKVKNKMEKKQWESILKMRKKVVTRGIMMPMIQIKTPVRTHKLKSHSMTSTYLR